MPLISTVVAFGSERLIRLQSRLAVKVLKLLIFRLVITYLGVLQIAPDHTIFVKKVPGEHAPPAMLLTF